MSNAQLPKGILPVLPVADVDKTVAYYAKTLMFEEVFRQPEPSGRSINAQVSFEDSSIMFNLNPHDGSREGGGIYLWVRLFEKDIDDYYDALKATDVEIVEAIQDQFWGDRSFVIKDCNKYHVAFNQTIKG